jgi:spore germination cell wall hydrolase CwlJ-like protein
MTWKGHLLLSIALVGAVALGGVIGIDSARPTPSPVIAVDLTQITVEQARLVDPVEAARPRPAVAAVVRLAVAQQPARPVTSRLLHIFFGTAFAGVPRLTDLASPPPLDRPALDPWAGAMQEVARITPPPPQDAVPALVPVSLPSGQAALVDPLERLADPQRVAGPLPVAPPPVQATAEPPLAPAAGVEAAPVALGSSLLPAQPGAAAVIDTTSQAAKPVVVASLAPTKELLAEAVGPAPAPVAAIVPVAAAPAPATSGVAVQAGSDRAVVATDDLHAEQPAGPGVAPVWARPRSSLLRVARPEPEVSERLDVALARAVSLIEPAGASWLRSAEADGAGRRLTGCGLGDLACSTFVSGSGSALDQPSPLLARHAGDTLSIGGVPLPAAGPDAEKALRCLAFTAYTEAGNQGTRGMAAVVWVVMNRIAISDDFGDSPCEVLADPGQFEPLQRPRFRAFAKAVRSGAMPKFPQPLNPQDEILLRTARLVVWQMLDGYFADDPTDGAQYFLAPAAMRALGRGMPAWTTRFSRTASIGDHVFYRPKRGG